MKILQKLGTNIEVTEAMRTYPSIVMGMSLAYLLAGPIWADDLEGLTDPSRPSAHGTQGNEGVNRGGLVLQSTLLSPERQFAVINGQKLTVGERIHGAQIVAIGPHEVILNRSGTRSALRMVPKSVVEKHEALPDAHHP